MRVSASIETFHGLSSHADHDHLVSWIRQFEQDSPAQVFVVHGDEDVSAGFAEELRGLGFRAQAPLYRESYDLLTGQITEEGVMPEKKKRSAFQSGSPQYRQLEEAGRRLEEVIRQNKGLSNKELGKFTSQLQALISKWQRDNR